MQQWPKEKSRRKNLHLFKILVSFIASTSVVQELLYSPLPAPFPPTPFIPIPPSPRRSSSFCLRESKVLMDATGLLPEPHPILTLLFVFFSCQRLPPPLPPISSPYIFNFGQTLFAFSSLSPSDTPHIPPLRPFDRKRKRTYFL